MDLLFVWLKSFYKRLPKVCRKNVQNMLNKFRNGMLTNYNLHMNRKGKPHATPYSKNAY